jgi:hypothetical protein
MRSWPIVLGSLATLALLGCGGANPPPPKVNTASAPPQRPRPCFTIRNDSEVRAKDAKKTLDDLVRQIQLAPEDEALRKPKSLADIRAILRRDTVYLFGDAAAYAHSLDTLESRFDEATLELLLGESQLVASQVLSVQEAWLGSELRIARANLATEGAKPSTDRGRMLAQLIRVVEEGNKIADVLGIVAPEHLVRGADLVRRLKKEAPNETRTFTLVAEYHRLRGEWTEFDAAMKSAEAADRVSPQLCYLRAMEQLDRHRKPDAGAAMMRDCLKRFPRFVRGQAGLVLMATNSADALRELDRLKEMNQDHYLVMLLEPALAADQELTRMKASNAP